MEETSKPETKFNMSLAILERINNILNDTAVFSSHQELDSWFDLLLTLKREVSYLLKQTEETTNSTHITGIMPLYFEYKKLKQRKIGWNKFWELYSKLEDYETFLKKLLYEKGLLIIHKEDIHKAVMRK